MYTEKQIQMLYALKMYLENTPKEQIEKDIKQVGVMPHKKPTFKQILEEEFEDLQYHCEDAPQTFEEFLLNKIEKTSDYLKKLIETKNG